MKSINYKTGKVIYDGFHIDFSKAFSEQLDNLTEDLLQVEFPGNFLLDIGWYPEYEPKGHFIVQLIKEENWEKPKYKKCCTKMEELYENIESVLNLINSYK